MFIKWNFLAVLLHEALKMEIILINPLTHKSAITVYDMGKYYSWRAGKKKPKKTKTREDVAPVSRRGSVRRARGFGARGSGVNTALLPWYLVRRVTDSRPLGGCLRHPPGSEAGRALQTGLRPSQGTVRVRIRTSSLNYRNVQATVTQAATIGFSAAILRSF